MIKQKKKIYHAECLCKGIKIKINGKIRHVSNCHCIQCVKTHGNFAAYTACEEKDLLFINKSTLKWFKSSKIATDNEGLQMISAYSSGSKVKVSDIKYLPSNKVFLLSIERTKVEIDDKTQKIKSICRFDFVDKVKSKNINQKNEDLILELVAIDYLKNKEDYEINLIFSNNAHIALTTETIEVRLEDQNEIKD